MEKKDGTRRKYENTWKYESLESLKGYVDKNLSNGDIILFLGAGDITQYAKNFSKLLDQGTHLWRQLLKS